MADIDQDVHALKEWLRAAWRQLGEPSLTSFARQELRTEMKRCSEDLRYLHGARQYRKSPQKKTAHKGRPSQFLKGIVKITPR
jgi:hypothetical protein